MKTDSRFEVLLDGLSLVHRSVFGLHRIHEHLVGERADEMLGNQAFLRTHQFLSEKKRTNIVRKLTCKRYGSFAA